METSGEMANQEPRKAYGFWDGTLVLAAWFLIFLVMATVIIFGSIIFFFIPWAGLAGLVISCLLLLSLPFFMSMKLDKEGWILGLSFSIVFLFIALPWYLHGKYQAYIWTLGSDFKKGYILIPVILAAGATLGYLGSHIASKRSYRTFNIKCPFKSASVILGFCIVVSVITPPIINRPGRSEFVKSEKYHFRVKSLAGWVWEEGTHSDERKGALTDFNFSSSTARNMGQSSVKIYIYRTTSYLGTSVESSSNPSDLYSVVLDELERSGYTVSKRENVVVDGKPGLKVVFLGDSGADFHNDNIFVLHGPYLYEIDLSFYKINQEEAKKIRKEFLDSFKFI